MIDCPDCKALHMGHRCHMTYAQRLRSVQLDVASLDTKDLKNYYDRESITKDFGDDAADRVQDKTKGLGAGRYRDGKHWHRDRKTKEWVETTPKEFDMAYLGNKEGPG